jgi:hypothetical protein
MADFPEAPLPWFDVKADFGATGDGATADQAAFAAAHAAAQGVGIVLVPPGTYMVEQVVMKAHMVGFNKRNTMIKSVASNTTPVGEGLLTNNTGLGGVSGTYNRGLWIDGNKANNAGNVFHGVDCQRTTRLFDCDVSQCTGDGVYHPDIENACEFRWMKVDNNDGHGFNIAGTDDKISDAIVSLSGLHGLYIDSNTQVFNTVSGNAGEIDPTTNGGDGFHIVHSGARIFGCNSQDNPRHGLYCEAIGASGGIFSGQMDQNTGAAVYIKDSVDLHINVMVRGAGVKKHSSIVELSGTNSRNWVHAQYSNTALASGQPAVTGTTTGNQIEVNTGAESKPLIVEHGAVGSTARPLGWNKVLWVGTATPANALDGDLWVDTT